jgi:hypothetical protein
VSERRSFPNHTSVQATRMIVWKMGEKAKGTISSTVVPVTQVDT